MKHHLHGLGKQQRQQQWHFIAITDTGVLEFASSQRTVCRPCEGSSYHIGCVLPKGVQCSSPSSPKSPHPAGRLGHGSAGWSQYPCLCDQHTAHPSTPSGSSTPKSLPHNRPKGPAQKQKDSLCQLDVAKVEKATGCRSRMGTSLHKDSTWQKRDVSILVHSCTVQQGCRCKPKQGLKVSKPLTILSCSASSAAGRWRM